MAYLVIASKAVDDLPIAQRVVSTLERANDNARELAQTYSDYYNVEPDETLNDDGTIEIDVSPMVVWVTQWGKSN